MENKLRWLTNGFYTNKMIRPILFFTSLVFIIISLLIIMSTSPADGYELSVYNAFPIYFWLFIFGSICIGLILLFFSIFIENNSRYWIAGIFIILTSNVTILLLPIFRGYFFIGGASADVFTHIGWINEIIETGHLGKNNFYPIIHILILWISKILGISIDIVVKFLPILFYLLYTPFIYLLAKSISKNDYQIILIMSFSTPLIFSVFYNTVHPSFLSFIFIPLLIYLYNKKIDTNIKLEFTVLLLIFCFFITFFHPITTIFLLLIFITFTVTSILLKYNKKIVIKNNINIEKQKSTNIILILFLSFFAWYTTYNRGLDSLVAIIHDFIFGSNSTIAVKYIATLNAANLTIFQTIYLMILRYGIVILYSLIAAIFALKIFYNFFILGKTQKIDFIYGFQLIVMLISSFAMIIFNFEVGNPIRVIIFFLLIVTILNGLASFHFLEWGKKQNKFLLKRISLSSIIILILLFSNILCIYNLYPSPTTWQPNSQFTYMNYATSIWFVEKRATNIQISGDFGFNIERIEHYVQGTQKGNMRIQSKVTGIFTHFGYNINNNTLAHVFNFTKTYIISTQNGKMGYQAFPINVQPAATQFSEEDYKKLNFDSTVSKLYDNGEVFCWQVYPK